MKFIHLLPVLALAGTVGATHELSGSWGAPSEAAAAQASIVPPWLRENGAEPSVEAGVSDPHAGLHADGDDPHAGLYADGDDPHAGLHDHGDDPHAGLHDHGDDPHADHTATDPGEGDAYARVGLAPAPEVPLPARIERSSAPNGRSVAQVFAERSALAQKAVRVRGTVVKLNEGILGKTYLHLRDGSGSADGGDDDLTVTTTESFQLGETVEVEGQLAIDQDVGAGYTYAALLTGAARVAP